MGWDGGGGCDGGGGGGEPEVMLLLKMVSLCGVVADDGVVVVAVRCVVSWCHGHLSGLTAEHANAIVCADIFSRVVLNKSENTRVQPERPKIKMR